MRTKARERVDELTKMGLDEPTYSRLMGLLNDRRPLGERVRLWHDLFRVEMANEIGPDLHNISDEIVSLRINLVVEEFLELMRKGYGFRVTLGLSTRDGVHHHTVMSPDERINPEWLTDVIPQQRRFFDAKEICDAHGDLRVVTAGADLVYGADPDAVDSEVMLGNATKLDEDGKPIVNRCVGTHIMKDQYESCQETGHLIDPSKPWGKVLKSARYVEPDIAGVIGLSKKD